MDNLTPEQSAAIFNATVRINRDTEEGREAYSKMRELFPTAFFQPKRKAAPSSLNKEAYAR